MQQILLHRRGLMAILCVAVVAVSLLSPFTAALAAASDATSAVTAPTASGDIFSGLFNFLYEKLLAPILNVLGIDNKAPATITPLPGKGGGTADLTGKVIVLDPGHGGSNPGAIDNGLREADLNLAVAQQLAAKLRSAGARVVMTRDSDRTVAAPGSSLSDELAARVNLAKREHADMFVSLHTNANSNPAINGAMTFYGQGKSPLLAQNIQKALIAATGATDKGVAAADFYVISSTPMPAALVEMGFISSAQEAARLGDSTYRAKIAQGIFNGINAYFN